jgi:ssDNA-binding Zn-finger/Zn-ribbon topoisomerase 1
MVNLQPEETGFPRLLERLLDKGVVVHSAIRINLNTVELVGIKSTVILTSLRTATTLGLDFPSGTHLDTPVWKDLISKQPCPSCGMESRAKDLKEEGCPWCGWKRRPRMIQHGEHDFKA